MCVHMHVRVTAAAGVPQLQHHPMPGLDMSFRTSRLVSVDPTKLVQPPPFFNTQEKPSLASILEERSFVCAALPV